MPWTPADIPDLTGRVAVVTGANTGLGLETARHLARAGAHVVMAARDVRRSDEARQDILRAVPTASLEVVALDLASLESVRQAAETVAAAHRVIDLLVNNAGVMATPEQRTADGFELQFGVNHLGHFALTAHLLRALLAAPAARVVTVTSTGRHLGRPVHPENPHLAGRYDPWRAYGQSKLANVHFAVELNRRFAAAGSAAAGLVAQPGLAATELQARSAAASGGMSQRFFHALARYTGRPAAAGAVPLLRAATDPAARGGELYAPRFGHYGPAVRRPLLPWSVNPEHTRILWEVSERETGVSFDVSLPPSTPPPAGPSRGPS